MSAAVCLMESARPAAPPPANHILRTSGIATALAFCIIVDSDGVIKEKVAAVSLTVDGAVTKGSGTWKGNSRPFFSTTGSGTTAHGITCTAAAISMTFASPGVALFAAFNNMLAGTGTNQYTSIIQDAVDDRGFGRGTSLTGPGAWEFSGGGATNGQLGVTNLPTDGSTKFSVSGNFVAGGQKTIYYGLESGALAQDSTGTDANFPGGFFPDHFGGVTGLGTQPGSPHILCGFNRALTLAEMQSLHGDGTNDWFSTLFAS